MFRDPPSANSRWVGWLVGAVLLALAVPGRWVVVGVVALVILALTAALAVRDRRHP